MIILFVLHPQQAELRGPCPGLISALFCKWRHYLWSIIYQSYYPLPVRCKEPCCFSRKTSPLHLSFLFTMAPYSLLSLCFQRGNFKMVFWLIVREQSICLNAFYVTLRPHTVLIHWFSRSIFMEVRLSPGRYALLLKLIYRGSSAMPIYFHDPLPTIPTPGN